MAGLTFLSGFQASSLFVISIWGVLMLSVLGYYYDRKNIYIMKEIHDPAKTSESCYYAAAIYAGVMIISGWQCWMNSGASAQRAGYQRQLN
eukprot:Nk52_evm27s1401 gene=Nk52_evmTU27s1401